MAFLTRAINWKLGSGDAVLRHMERALAWTVIATVFFLLVSEALKNIAYAVSLALYVCIICFTGERIFVPPPARVLMSLLGVTILSAAVSAYPERAIRGVWEVFRYTSFFFIVERAVREEKHVLGMLWAAVTGLGFIALIRLPRYPVLGLPLLSPLPAFQYGIAPQFVLMVLTLIFGMYVHLNPAGWRLVWLTTVAGLSVTLLVIMRTRMIWGGFILVTVILGWLRSARMAGIVLAFAILMAIGVAFVDSDVKDRVVSLDKIHTYTAMSGRVQLWEKAVAMWRDSPWLGVGPRTFVLHPDVAQDIQRSRYGFDYGQAHNLWIHTAVEMGVVGVLVLTAVLAYLGFWLLRRRRQFPPPWPAAVWDGAFGSWLAILVGGMTEPGFGREHAMFFSMLLALLQTRALVGHRSEQVASGTP